MLEYALEAKRAAPRNDGKRELAKQLKKKVPVPKVERDAQKQIVDAGGNKKGYIGKGKGKRNKKNLKQIDLLEKIYRVK